MANSCSPGMSVSVADGAWGERVGVDLGGAVPGLVAAVGVGISFREDAGVDALGQEGRLDADGRGDEQDLLGLTRIVRGDGGGRAGDVEQVVEAGDEHVAGLRFLETGTAEGGGDGVGDGEGGVGRFLRQVEVRGADVGNPVALRVTEGAAADVAGTLDGEPEILLEAGVVDGMGKGERGRDLALAGVLGVDIESRIADRDRERRALEFARHVFEPDVGTEEGARQADFIGLAGRPVFRGLEDQLGAAGPAPLAGEPGREGDAVGDVLADILEPGDGALEGEGQELRLKIIAGARHLSHVDRPRDG